LITEQLSKQIKDELAWRKGLSSARNISTHTHRLTLHPHAKLKDQSTFPISSIPLKTGNAFSTSSLKLHVVKLKTLIRNYWKCKWIMNIYLA